MQGTTGGGEEFTAIGCTPQQLATDPALRARYPWMPTTKSSICRGIERGEIPATRVGRRLIIDLRALEAQVDTRRYA